MNSAFLVWPAVVVLALAVAAWARYVMDRNSEDEVQADIRRPVVLSAVLLLLVVAVSVYSSVAE